MNFASDNIVGASAPVHGGLDAAPMRGAMPAYGNDELTARVKAPLRRDLRTRSRCLSGRRPARPPMRSRWRQPFRPGACASATGRPMSSTTNAARRNSSCMGQSSSGLPGVGGKIAPGGRGGLPRQPAQGRQADAAEGAVDLAGHRMRHGLFARRNRSARRGVPRSTGSPSTWTGRVSPTRSCRSAVRPPT